MARNVQHFQLTLERFQEQLAELVGEQQVFQNRPHGPLERHFACLKGIPARAAFLKARAAVTVLACESAPKCDPPELSDSIGTKEKILYGNGVPIGADRDHSDQLLSAESIRSDAHGQGPTSAPMHIQCLGTAAMAALPPVRPDGKRPISDIGGRHSRWPTLGAKAVIPAYEFTIWSRA